MPRTAAIYARISDDRAGSGLGVSRQETDCRRLCESRGWAVADVYVDNDVSAYSGKVRPGYRRMLADLQAGRIDAIVAWHPDRLHRSPRELEDFVDVVEKSRAAIATVTAGEYDLATPSGRMVARVLGAVARGESEHKSERIARKHEQLAASGEGRGGGTRPFGFKADRLSVDPKEAKLIRQAAERVLAGASVRSIALEWNSRGVRSVTGQPWSPHVLKTLLASPRVAGLREHRGKVVSTAVWPAIISADQHQALRRILMDPSRRKNHLLRRYLLSGGLLRCGECGAPLVARPRDDKRRAYVCARGPGFKGCGRTATLAEPVEDFVVQSLFVALDSSELVRKIAEHRTPSVDDRVLAEQVRAEEAKLLDLADLYGDGAISRAEWLRLRDQIQARLSAAQQELGARTGAVTAVPFLGDGRRLQKTWEGLPLERQRLIVAAVLDSVVIHRAVRGRSRFDPDRFELIWRF